MLSRFTRCERSVAFLLLILICCASDAFPLSGVPIARLESGQRDDPDFFGWSVALDAGQAAVGAPVFAGDVLGAVFVYDSATAEEIDQIDSSRLEHGQRFFGSAVDLSGSDLIVGSEITDGWGDSWSRPTHTHVYNLDTQAIVEFPLPGPPGFFQGTAFGNAVAIHNGLALIGEPNNVQRNQDVSPQEATFGLAHLLDVVTGELIQTFAPRSRPVFPISGDALPNRHYGDAVALSDRYAVVASRSDAIIQVIDLDSGAVVRTIDPIEESAFSNFDSRSAVELAVEGDIAVFGIANREVANVFDLQTGELLHELRPTAADEATSRFFGSSVAIDDGRILVGASGAGLAGEAYLFDASSGEQLATLVPNEEDNYGRFGWSVALDGDLALVGAPRTLFRTGTESPGSAYLFQIVPEPAGASLLIASALAPCLRRRHPRTCPVPDTTYL